jgi:hypothetical protein
VRGVLLLLQQYTLLKLSKPEEDGTHKRFYFVRYCRVKWSDRIFSKKKGRFLFPFQVDVLLGFRLAHQADKLLDRLLLGQPRHLMLVLQVLLGEQVSLLR